MASIKSVTGYATSLAANVAATLVDPATQQPITLPKSAAVFASRVVLEGAGGLNIQTTILNLLNPGRLYVGYTGNSGAFIDGDFTAYDLNTRRCISVSKSGVNLGLLSQQTITIQTDVNITGDFIVVELFYYTE